MQIKYRYIGFISGAVLPLLLHFIVYVLDKHESHEVLLAFFMVLHAIIYIPIVIVLSHGVIVGCFTIVLWGILGFLCGFLLDRKIPKQKQQMNNREQTIGDKPR